MSFQNTNLVIQGSQLPATFKGKPNDLFQAMLARMRIVSPSGTSFFVTSDTEPSSNQGPWLKGGTQWWVWSADLKRYVPLDISESETHWFWMGSTTPPSANPPVWLKTDSTPSEASPDAFGNPIAWFVYNGTDWVRLPTIIEDRTILQSKLDFKATNFFGVVSGTNSYSVTLTPSTNFGLGNGTTETFLGFFKFTNANTGPVTLNVNGSGNKPVKKQVNLDIAAGEIAAGSVHAVIFDGTNYQILSELFSTTVPPPIGGIGSSEGLVIINDATTPDEIVNITANAVLLQNTGGGSIQVSNPNVDIDITVSGLNGLDTGAAVIDTWYYIWLISDGTTPGGLFSLSSTAPTMPTGYTFKALLGAIYVNSTTDLIKIWQTGRKVYTVDTAVPVTGIGLLPIITAVPPIARTVFGSLKLISTGGSVTDAYAIIAGDSDGRGQQTIWTKEDAGNVEGGGFFDLPLITAQNVYVVATGGNTSLDIAGFTV